MTTLDDLRPLALARPEQVAEVLGLGRSATYDACARGDLPSLRIGRRLFIPVPALLRLLGAENDDAGAADPGARPDEPAGGPDADRIAAA